jgi:hypothetical protein
MTHVDFHCGRCRLRGCLKIGEGESGRDLDLTAVETFIAATHRALSPDCQATGDAIQILRVGPESPAILPRRARRRALQRTARSN